MIEHMYWSWRIVNYGCFWIKDFLNEFDNVCTLWFEWAIYVLWINYIPIQSQIILSIYLLEGVCLSHGVLAST